MRFKPFSGDNWYYLKALSSPDAAERDLLHNRGEFSLSRQEAFERHLNRYPRLNKFYANQNGKRLKSVLKHERLWYGKQGLEEIVELT